MTPPLVLTKSGPRLIDLYRDENLLVVLVNGPGMLYSKLEFMTNRSVVDGASYSFFQKIAHGLEATVDCPHAPMRRAEITVESHRLGAELSINIGPPSMYQNELRIRTTSGITFRELIDQALRGQYCVYDNHTTLVAVLVAVRAKGHHEHHSSRQESHERDTLPSTIPHAQETHSSHISTLETEGGQQQ